MKTTEKILSNTFYGCEDFELDYIQKELVKNAMEEYCIEKLKENIILLDKEIVKKYLQIKFKDYNIKLPEDIDLDELVEAFCMYAKNRYFEWLDSNFTMFFDGCVGIIGWNNIKNNKL